MSLVDCDAALTALHSCPTAIRSLRELDLIDSLQDGRNERFLPILRQTTALQKVSLDCRHFSSDAAALLAALAVTTSLQELVVVNFTAASTDTISGIFSAIHFLSSLQRITLQDVSNDFVPSLSGLPHLTSLDISCLTEVSGNEVDTTQGLVSPENLAPMFPHLRHLSIRRVSFQRQFSNAGRLIGPIARCMHELRSLELDIRGVDDLDVLARMAQLTALHVILTNQNAKLHSNRVRLPPNIQKLELTDFQDAELVEDMMVKGYDRGVRSIGVYGLEVELTLPVSQLEDLSELQIDLGYTTEEPLVFATWYQFSCLTRLRLLAADVGRDAARALSCISSLEEVDLARCQLKGEEALQELMWLPHLKRVVLSEDQRGEVKVNGVDLSKLTFVETPFDDNDSSSGHT